LSTLKFQIRICVFERRLIDNAIWEHGVTDVSLPFWRFLALAEEAPLLQRRLPATASFQ